AGRGAAAASFFFQAEDGIRDFHVTGVQTCALPIFGLLFERGGIDPVQTQEILAVAPMLDPRRLQAGLAVEFVAENEGQPAEEIRSEERRGGKESSRARDHDGAINKE